MMTRGNADYDYGCRFEIRYPDKVQAVGWWHGRSLYPPIC